MEGVWGRVEGWEEGEGKRGKGEWREGGRVWGGVWGSEKGEGRVWGGVLGWEWEEGERKREKEREGGYGEGSGRVGDGRRE